MWFQRLWNEQVVWMEERLLASSADWHVVVTHFPPQYHVEVWARLAEMYAIDLIVTGHRHQQEVSGRDPKIGQAAWVVSGGGGGITSEGSPCKDGNDDMYGFFDVTISHERIKLEAISHSGVVRRTTMVKPRSPSAKTTATSATAGNTSSAGGSSLRGRA
mmetsp:Transcript_30419/g.101052  ORF Transcript_30419/g.101052 Transcript_30419/m.101052 type:complete len:160 (-) Transcript_30419:38-517(-)